MAALRALNVRFRQVRLVVLYDYRCFLLGMRRYLLSLHGLRLAAVPALRSLA